MGRPLVLALLAMATQVLASPPDREVRVVCLEPPGQSGVFLTLLPQPPSGASMPSVASSNVASAVRRSEAQSGAASTAVQPAGISGRVTAGGHPAPGVMVIAVPANGGVAAHAVSGPDGTYEIAGIPEGVYLVDFDLLGFDITRLNHVRVSAKTTANADAVLYGSAICECVTVTPKQPLRARVGQVLSASGDPLPHARLHVGGEFDYADGEGRFTILLPLDEPMPVTVSESGFQSATQQVSGAGTAPIVFRLTAADGASLPDTERLTKPCCPGVFTHGR